MCFCWRPSLSVTELVFCSWVTYLVERITTARNLLSTRAMVVLRENTAHLSSVTMDSTNLEEAHVKLTALLETPDTFLRWDIWLCKSTTVSCNYSPLLQRQEARMREYKAHFKVLLRPFEVGGGGKVQELCPQVIPSRDGRGGFVATVGAAE